MHLVVGRIEVVVQMAFFFKRSLWACQIAAFEERIPLRNVLLKTPC